MAPRAISHRTRPSPTELLHAVTGHAPGSSKFSGGAQFRGKDVTNTVSGRGLHSSTFQLNLSRF